MTISRRQVLSLLAAGAALLGFAAAAPGPAAAQEKTLKVRFYDDPAGFDPASIFRIENENIAFNIFSGLTTYDGATGKIIPDLAESWETEDNLHWKFNLRKGVKWQKGYGEFTAADVLYSYGRIRDPKTASPYAAELANIAKIEAPDPYTVLIELKSPDGNFLHQVANYHQGQIVNKKAIEDAGDKVRWNPVGTGPYALDFIDVNARIILKSHKEYYKGPAPIDTILFQIIKDENTSTIALRNGEIDLVMRANREEHLATLQKEGFKMNKVENYAVALKVYNTAVKPLADVRVRQALAYAIDYETINKAVAPSLQFAAYSMLMPWMDVYSDDIPKYKYDPEKAKKLLAEAGYAKGLTIKQLSTSAQGVTELQQFEIDYLAQVGVTMKMELVDTPTFNQRRNAGDFETATRLLPAVNPDMILFSYLHPSNISPKGLNGARYDNPKLTALLEGARAEVDPKKRKAMYAEVQKIAMTDLYYMPQYANNVIWPSKQKVTGVKINYLAQVNFYEVDVK
ncbi:ABC transporter substrate-binding protein [Prosthecomicrobium sp. N25]|uniref:ABC transporter substrate-binding protein n=1 Tax=Prosthecomicrobium sp. N25 TaxID=3129254 RepID=UPI003077E3F5